MMAMFILDAMLVKATFQSALSNNIVAEHSELWSGVQFCIMDKPICYKLRIISITTGMSIKCYSPKSLPSFKASLELSFSRIMHAHILQKLFETLFSPTHLTFLAGSFSGYVAY